MLNKSIRVAGVTIAAVLSSTVFAKSANALDFGFTFGSGINTVSGTIKGLTDNSTGAASEVSITTPDNVTFTSANPNTFTVAGGNITTASYTSSTAGSNLALFTAFGNYKGTAGTPTFSSGMPSGGGATPVPFGVVPDMGILILGGMFAASRLRKKITARKLAIGT